MNKLFFVFILSITAYFTISCSEQQSTESKTTEAPSAEIPTTEFLKGKTLYEARCANCHRKDGMGMGTLYPPIAGSDYLKDHKDKIACMIRYGANEEIVVNGKTYKMQMLGYNDLNEVEISDIMNYIFNAWGNKVGPVTKEDVEKALAECEQAAN